MYTREIGRKNKRMGVVTEKGKRLGFAPAMPVIPASPSTRLRAVLPAWMWRDPAEVVERIELQALAKAERERLKRRAHEAGLSDTTVRAMRRLRIKELVDNVLRGKP